MTFHRPPYGASFPPPPRQRSTADKAATITLFVIQAGASLLALAAAALGLLWTMMPICSDDCDSPAVTRFVHNMWSGAGVIVGGIALAALLAGIGAIVSGVRRTTRRTVMWKWPALGLAIVFIAFAIAVLAYWGDAMPKTK
ncbi:hypothetical protein A5745_20705 [Mycobacterium sp. IS-2888]|uniref:hypothetical protein n=1 Tax=unclassified Mycobacterium TaxID=2642494 RepID=UPI00096E4E23|nr:MULTISPECIES: hypothetical protein [unclassified Mycobacterium]OMC40982.1 hypothetical protein A5744_18680 [Mycobacterium sp. IS-1264]OMC53939.1 hypothetical protein A5745_20705 [Mycobacterium sp. IS-2888]